MPATKDFLALYEYVGGGYFRQKNVKKGEKAEILHGVEAIEVAMKLAFHSGFRDGFSTCEKGYNKR